MAEVAVIGSGPSGVHAAQTLLEGGHRVTLLDFGHRDRLGSLHAAPDRPFLDVRHTDPEQYRYFWGPRFEGVPLGRLRAGSGLSAPRQYVTEEVDRWAPTSSDTFHGVESLARGGLGGAWGLGCFVMSDAELDQMGLDPVGLEESYQRVSERIGVSADDADGSAPYRGRLQGLLPPLDIDEASELLLARYRAIRGKLDQRGVRVGRTMLALLSRDHDGRRACAYHDMEFWSDHGRSAWRPEVLLDALEQHPNFRYCPGALATRFEETGGAVETEYLLACAAPPTRQRIRSDRLVLCSGTLGTARIVLRSLGTGGQRLPLLCNPYRYVLCVQPALLGRSLRNRRHSMGQLVLSYDRHGNGSHVPIASLLSYRALLLTRLIKESPLAAKESRAILQRLTPAFTLAGVFHPDYPGPPGEDRAAWLEPDPGSPTGDRLHVSVPPRPATARRVREDQSVILKSLRRLGAYPLRAIDPGDGSSIHYGGTLPFVTHGTIAAPWHVDPGSGRLHGTARVFVADGSPFKVLPAKGITLTLMAYADWVCRRLE